MAAEPAEWPRVDAAHRDNAGIHPRDGSRYVDPCSCARTVDDICPSYQFNITCQKTVPQAPIWVLEANNFEDTIRNAISLGGDAGTVALIAGGVARR